MKLTQIGYATAPASKDAPSSNPLLFRFAICAALSMNSMVLSAAFYLGLAPHESPLIYRVFSWTNLILSTLCLWVGGSVFFKSAWQALKHRLIHLDLPIALGLVLGFLGSLISFFSTQQDAVFFDTLNIFITLMLLGRILQSRIIEHNRRILLRDNSIQNLFIRKIMPKGVSLVSAQTLLNGDVILLVPGEVLPCAAKLESEQAIFSLEWIQGESQAHRYQKGDTLPAGAFQVGEQSSSLQLIEDFENSQLVRLLACTDSQIAKNQTQSPLFPRLSRYYTLAVLFLAIAGFAWWIPTGFESALRVTVALLVVTCPCAIGLATPLALDLAIVRLRRVGLYIRNTDFLNRIRHVQHCFLDKTGTLTFGELMVTNPEVFKVLNETERSILFQMVVRSNHPKSRAVLPYVSAQLDPNAQVQEIIGKGMKLGDWSFDGTLRRENQIVAEIKFSERLKEDVIQELQSLKLRSIDLYIVSGDRPQKVRQLADALGIPESHTWGGLNPFEKAERIREIDNRNTMMIGDGINDSPAFDAAFCAGTPAVLHPSLPAKADFFFLGAGLGPLSTIFKMADHLHNVILRNLLYAFAYNVLAISLAFVGVLSPVFAAIFMPASSISIIAITLTSFRRKKL